MIPAACEAIYKILEDEYFHVATAKHQWEQLAEEFASKLQFPHAKGTTDGQCVNVWSPPNTSPKYFNCKKQFSTGLLAVADACAKFIMFAYGSQSNGEIFNGYLVNICIKIRAKSIPSPFCPVWG